MKKLLALVCICIYMFTSQFITKARATTAREDFAIDEDCSTQTIYSQAHCPHTNKKIDTFESKKNCRGKTYGELHSLQDLSIVKNSDTPYCIASPGHICKHPIYDHRYIFDQNVKPPPDDDDIYDLSHYRIGITEKRE